MADWPNLGSRFIKTEVFAGNNQAAAYWSGVFDKVHKGEIDTWDYQWVLHASRTIG